MFPLVYALLSQDSDVASLVGTRIYRHGSAPERVEAPYITWFVVSGVPENNLSDSPPIDDYLVQVDCWSDNDGTGDTGIETLALAVRTVLETDTHVESITADGRDPDTKRFRASLQVRFWTYR